MFLESDPSYSLGSGGPSLSFPLILDPSYDYEKKSERGDYKVQNKKLKDRISNSQNELVSLWKHFLDEWEETIVNEPKITNVFRKYRNDHRKISTELADILRNNAKFSTLHSENLQMLSKYQHDVRTLGRLEKTINGVAKSAKKNARSISHETLKLPQDKQQIFSSLSKLSKYVDFSIDSICLDCWFEQDQMPFVAHLDHTKHVDLQDRCPNCTGTGIIHTINMGLPKSLSLLILLDSSWLYEVIIGSAISKMGFVKHVYVHKKIQAYREGLVQKGVEAYVIIVTNDDKLYMVEVTKQADTSHIVNNITRKIRYFEAASIPFEKMMYFTSDDKSQHLDTDGGKARIFQLKHLPHLGRFVKEMIGIVE